MKRAVSWTPRSRTDFADIVKGINAENPTAAANVAARIKRAVSSLGDIPTGRPGRVRGVYEKSVTGAPYIVAYQFLQLDAGAESVVIVRVIHQARDWPTESWPQD